ncbi:hypothetical protein GQ457_07G016470 [Hibiscus cannabinus]
MVLLVSSISAATLASSPESEDRVYFRWRYKVHTLNGMPDNVTRVIITCHSNEDDLDAHTPFQGKEFKFEFITSFIKKTHFICTFWWGVLYAKDVSVFDDVVETVFAAAFLLVSGSLQFLHEPAAAGLGFHDC